jgi:hypothetical protein
MKIPGAIVLLELLLVILMPGLFIAESYGKKSDPADDCEARCAAMDSESRYRCMKTCINAKRKNDPVGRNDVKGRMAACEDACVDYTGVDRIKCIRLCLDRNKEPVVIKRDALKQKNENPCEMRCSVLSGVSKDTCLLRCERESHFEKKD